MIRSSTALGSIGITDKYFSSLVAQVLGDCYGVAGLTPSFYASSVQRLSGTRQTTGVETAFVGGQLFLGLHILVTFGVNIETVAKSTVEKVKYEIENATGLNVARVDIFVDDIIG